MFVNNVCSIFTSPPFKIYIILPFDKIFVFHPMSWIKIEANKVAISWFLIVLFGYTVSAYAQTCIKDITYSFLSKTNTSAILCISILCSILLFLIHKYVISATYKHKVKYLHAINGLRCMARLVCIILLFAILGDCAYSKIHVLTAHRDVLPENTAFHYEFFVFTSQYMIDSEMNIYHRNEKSKTCVADKLMNTPTFLLNV